MAGQLDAAAAAPPPKLPCPLPEMPPIIPPIIIPPPAPIAITVTPTQPIGVAKVSEVITTTRPAPAAPPSPPMPAPVRAPPTVSLTLSHASDIASVIRQSLQFALGFQGATH